MGVWRWNKFFLINFTQASNGTRTCTLGYTVVPTINYVYYIYSKHTIIWIVEMDIFSKNVCRPCVWRHQMFKVVPNLEDRWQVSCKDVLREERGQCWSWWLYSTFHKVYQLQTAHYASCYLRKEDRLWGASFYHIL